jgi:hypothetical protein
MLMCVFDLLIGHNPQEVNDTKHDVNKRC